MSDDCYRCAFCDKPMPSATGGGGAFCGPCRDYLALIRESERADADARGEVELYHQGNQGRTRRAATMNAFTLDPEDE